MSVRNRVDCPNYHQVISKKGAKSNIWQYFGCPGDENGKIITDNISICKLCQSAVSSKATSNLWSHLKCHHPLQYSSLHSSSNPRIVFNQMIDTDVDANILQTTSASNPGCSSQNYEVLSTAQAPVLQNNVQKSLLDYTPLDDKGAKKCTLAIAKFLANSMQPFCLVDDDSFKQMIKALNPRYTLPGRKHFSTTAIPRLYNEAVEKLKVILSKSDNQYVSLTCDCWTSLAGQPYLAVTVHFIDAKWNLISACLSCCYFEEKHSAENIKNLIEIKLEEWGLLSQLVVSCTTDNGTNVINAVDLLGIIRIPCFAHTINIGVNRCIEIPQIKRAIGRLKSLQNSISHSWKMKKDLKEAQELLQCDIKVLPSACPTRWWSTLKLCKRFLENQLPIVKMLQNFPTQKHLMPEGSEVSYIESFVEGVSNLQDVSDNLTGENYVTSSAILPLIRQIKKNVKVSEDDSQLQKNLKENILNVLSRYDDEPLKGTLQKCTFLDPRFRLSFFDDDVKDNVEEIVKNELKAIYSCNLNLMETEVKSPPKKKKKGLEALLEDEEDSTPDNPESKSTKELEKYVSMPKVGLNSNPLEWWMHYASSFSGLSILAKKYLCMQGSSVPSERVFSKGGNIINKKRCTLSPKNAEMQIFLSYNKRILQM